MILIVSEEVDITTDFVIDWLLVNKTTFKRINTNIPNSISLNISNNAIDLSFNAINSLEYKKSLA